jgi:hypothetical protein
MELKDYLQLKKKVDKYQRELDQSKGELKQLMATLLEQYGCKTIKEAKRLLKKLRRREHAAETKFKAGLKRFEQRWRKQLDKRSS